MVFANDCRKLTTTRRIHLLLATASHYPQLALSLSLLLLSALQDHQLQKPLPPTNPPYRTMFGGRKSQVPLSYSLSTFLFLTFSFSFSPSFALALHSLNHTLTAAKESSLTRSLSLRHDLQHHHPPARQSSKLPSSKRIDSCSRLWREGYCYIYVRHCCSACHPKNREEWQIADEFRWLSCSAVCD